MSGKKGVIFLPVLLYLVVVSAAKIVEQSSRTRFSRQSTSTALTSSEAIEAAEHFRLSFGVPYIKTIHFLAHSVFKPLAQAPVPETTSAATPFVRDFAQAINAFSQQLQPLNESSHQFREILDLLTETTTLEHSNVEQTLFNTTRELAEVNQKINSAQQQLTDSQRQVDKAEASFQSAERIFRDAEDRLNRGENCIIRKRRDIWGDIGRVFTHHIPSGVQRAVQVVERVVVRDIPHVATQVGEGAEKFFTKDVPHVAKQVINSPCQIQLLIDSSLRKDRDNARDQKNAAVDRRDGIQKKHAEHVASRDKLLQEQGQLTSRRDGLGATLRQLTEEKVKAVAINVKIKQVIVHLSGLIDRGMMLHQILSKLIDVETLINPLKEISQFLLAFANCINDEARNLASLQTVISGSAQVLQDKLPLYPFVTVNLTQ